MVQKISLKYWSALAFVTFFFYFRTSLLWMAKTFVEPHYYEYGIFFLILVVLMLSALWKHRKEALSHWGFSAEPVAIHGLILMIGLDFINALWWHYHLISAFAFLMGFYFLMGCYLPKHIWKRGVYLAGIISLTLPFAEHIQTFLGFPIRIVTAKAVSVLLGLMGHSNISQATVIFTENTATSIDLPCSGVKSIYIGTLLMLTVYFFKRVTFSLRLILVSLAFYFSLLFLNFWRVFSLIFIVDIMGFQKEGDAIHVFLGVLGFLLSAYLLLYLSTRFLSSHSDNTLSIQKKSGQKTLVILILGILLFDGASSLYFKSKPLDVKEASSSSTTFDFSQEDFQDLPFSQKERDFFDRQELQFAKKFRGEVDGNPFALLMLTSTSWRSHHNPEICIQGMGHQVDHSKIVQLNGIDMRQATLKNDEGVIFYWFVGKDEIISDYSQRIWKGILNPNDAWSLVVLRVRESKDIESPGFIELIERVNAELSRQE